VSSTKCFIKVTQEWTRRVCILHPDSSPVQSILMQTNGIQNSCLSSRLNCLHSFRESRTTDYASTTQEEHDVLV
jgi:hypothetical protein